MIVINKRKHEHLVGAVSALEVLFADHYDQEGRHAFAELTYRKQQLENIYQAYQNVMEQLATLTKAYHEEASDTKINLLAKRLKQLKASTHESNPDIHLFRLSLRLFHSS